MIKSAIHSILVCSFETCLRFIFSLPRFRTLNYIKASFLKLQGAKIGKRVVFYPGVWIATGKNLEVGDDVDIALEVLITTNGGVKIGDRTLIGYRTQIISSNHVIPESRGRIFGAGHKGEPITIENDVWIGANCLILPGVTIGQGAVVGGGSVVTRNVKPFTIVAGCPAKLLRERT